MAADTHHCGFSVGSNTLNFLCFRRNRSLSSTITESRQSFDIFAAQSYWNSIWDCPAEEPSSSKVKTKNCIPAWQIAPTVYNLRDTFISIVISSLRAGAKQHRVCSWNAPAGFLLHFSLLQWLNVTKSPHGKNSTRQHKYSTQKRIILGVMTRCRKEEW